MFQIRNLLKRRPTSKTDLPTLLSDQEMEYLKEKGKYLVPEKPSKPTQYPEDGPFLRSRLLDNGPRCLHCHSDQFYEGPHGGMAVNIKCAGETCGWVYNYLGELGLMILQKESPGPFTFQAV